MGGSSPAITNMLKNVMDYLSTQYENIHLPLYNDS